MSASSDAGGTDYPWRARVSHAAFAAAVAKMAGDIDYANFKNAVASAQGSERSHIYAGVWTAASRLESLAASKPPPSRSPHGRKVAFGGVVFDEEGRVLLREPSGHYGGYVWTFPKGRPEAGESPERAALREVREETGVTARVVGELADWFEGDTTNTRFFVMRRVEEGGDFDAETSQVRWVEPDEARKLLAETRSSTGRKRDLSVLGAALRWMESR